MRGRRRWQQRTLQDVAEQGLVHVLEQRAGLDPLGRHARAHKEDPRCVHLAAMRLALCVRLVIRDTMQHNTTTTTTTTTTVEE